MRFLAVLITMMFVCSRESRAQIDPSSALLLNSGRTVESTLDSGRYEIRPRPDGQSRKDDGRSGGSKKANPREGDETVDASPVTVTVPDSEVPASKGEVPMSSPTPTPSPTPASQVAGPQVVEPSPVRVATPRDLSRRLNLIEISLAPGYLYSSSDSEYYFRRYSMAAPVLSVDANVWLSPYFGLSGGYIATLSGHVSDSLTTTKNVPATHEWFTAGLRGRRFFGNEAMADSITVGLDYLDYRFRVPSDATVREKLSSIGLRLSVEAETPVTAYRSWLFGVSFAPKLRHSEDSSGAAGVQSGGNVDANAVSISLGGRMQFDRMNAIFWKLAHTVEKDMFSGTASTQDPASGQTPTGVSVIQSTTIFLFGYTWGN